MQAMADRLHVCPDDRTVDPLAWACSDVAPRSASAGAAACAAVSWVNPVWKDALPLHLRRRGNRKQLRGATTISASSSDRRGRFDEPSITNRETLRIKPGDRHGEANYAQAISERRAA